MDEKVLAEGAEARIILRGNHVVKERIAKGYRLQDLDETIRKRRTKSERKLLTKAAEFIFTPKPLESKEKHIIIMPFIDGEKLSESLNNYPLKKQLDLLRLVGGLLAKLHQHDIIHGDLTTSNMILKEGHVHILDFGLGFISKKIEDRAVDIHLLKQALEAKHYQYFEQLFDAFLEGYKENSLFEKVLQQLKAVEKRGRYRH